MLTHAASLLSTMLDARFSAASAEGVVTQATDTPSLAMGTKEGDQYFTIASCHIKIEAQNLTHVWRHILAQSTE